MRQKKTLSLESASLGLLLVIPFLLVGLYFWALDPFAFFHPSDHELMVLFRNNRNSFERLRVMALEDDHIYSYLSEATLTSSGLSEGRCHEYKQLLLGIRRDLVIRTGTRVVSFSYSGGGVGLAIASSWMKGIA